MTEEEWLGCEVPGRMLAYLHKRSSERRRRLFALACCRRAWHLLGDERSHRALKVAELYADGLATREELSAAEEIAQEACADARDSGAEAAEAAADLVYVATVAGVGWDIAGHASSCAARTAAACLSRGRRAAQKGELAAQLPLLRCIFGNPFRPVSLKAAWLTPDVVALVQSAYDERLLPSGELDGQRLQVLADALEDAGCHSADALSHLRGPGAHVRGCFVVDLLTGRE